MIENINETITNNETETEAMNSTATSLSLTSECTLYDASAAFLEYLKTQGKKEATIKTYSKDFEQIVTFFGADRKLKNILKPHVAQFFKSDMFLKLPNGKDRAKPTIDKTMRIFRMMLIWAQDNGIIQVLPLPKDTPMGRNAKKEKANAQEISIAEPNPDQSDLAPEQLQVATEEYVTTEVENNEVIEEAATPAA